MIFKAGPKLFQINSKSQLSANLISILPPFCPDGLARWYSLFSVLVVAPFFCLGDELQCTNTIAPCLTQTFWWPSTLRWENFWLGHAKSTITTSCPYQLAHRLKKVKAAKARSFPSETGMSLAICPFPLCLNLADIGSSGSAQGECHVARQCLR